MSNKRLKIIFGLIVVLAFILRFYQLGNIPVSLYWDEVAVGYNALSIASNLKDEHGVFMPLMFRSFGEYKMPAYVYLTAPLVKVFGLNEVTIRFWSAVLGMVAVIGSFFLVREMLLTGKLKKKINKTTIDSISIVTMFLMSISIWHVHFSRIGFEANGLLTCAIIGFWLFFLGLRKKGALILSAVVLGVSMYFYRGVIAFLPLILIAGIALNVKQLISREYRKYSLIALFIFLFISLPITTELFSDRGLERTEEVSILNLQNSEHVDNLVSMQTSSSLPLKEIIFNRRIGYGLDFITGYGKHLSPQFLFFEGDTNPRHNGSNTGVFYIWMLPFLILGFIALWKLSIRLFIFTIVWILASPIPAALSVPTPHALRSLNMLPMGEFVTAIGIVSLFYIIGKKYRILYVGLLGVIIAAFLAWYVSYYYRAWPAHSAEEWGDGHKQMLSYIKSNENQYEKVIISGHYWQPYIYTLFYTQYDPTLYQEDGSNREFGKYKFGGTSWDHEQYDTELDLVDLKEFGGEQKMLIVLSPYEYQKQKVNLRKLAEIKNHDGKVVFIISENL